MEVTFIRVYTIHRVHSHKRLSKIDRQTDPSFQTGVDERDLFTFMEISNWLFVLLGKDCLLHAG